MSSSSEFSDAGRFSGKKPVPEKKNFSQTCNLLSQYLKENGKFGDLSLGMNRNLDGNGHKATTMNLLSNIEKSGEVSKVLNRNGVKSQSVTSTNLFPQQKAFCSSVSAEEAFKKADSRINKPAYTEPENAQMTIFYGGQVLVFNNFPAAKAKEIMLLASHGTTQNRDILASAMAKNPIESSNMFPSLSNNMSNFLFQRPQSIALGLPIARKASLHRFLEKRKDRMVARLPYHVMNSTTTSPKSAELNTWLGLA